MKTISLWQPWASLVAHGLKHFETRSWYTGYRGPLAIHAAKRPAKMDELNSVIKVALVGIGYQKLSELPYGCIVCTVLMVGCEPTAQVVNRPYFKAVEHMERYFGDYTPGRFAWQLSTQVPVENIPARGSQGFWDWQPEGGPVAAAREVRT